MPDELAISLASMRFCDDRKLIGTSFSSSLSISSLERDLPGTSSAALRFGLTARFRDRSLSRDAAGVSRHTKPRRGFHARTHAAVKDRIYTIAK
eukprot:2980272-Heterocapsa_arctica.AAC.1